MKNLTAWIYLVCIAGIFCCIVLPVQGQSPSELFKKANAAYQKENYEEAAKLYEQMIKFGNDSWEVYFNLGNAYYKTGRYEAAILNYERAKKLNEADDDIDYNLKLANMQSVDKIEPLPQVFYQKWWDEFISSSNPDARARHSLVALWIAMASFMLYIFVRSLTIKKIGFYAGVVCLIVAGSYFLLAYEQNSIINNKRYAIIYITSDYVKSSPDEKSANLFMLHAGTKVEVLDELQGWKKIRIANGNVGWIPAKSIETI